MKVGILGYGREGQALLTFLKKDPEYKTADFTVLDRNPALKVPRGTQAKTGEGYLRELGNFDILFRTPGIPYLLPELQGAKEDGVGITSLTALFLERCPTQMVIGVTGTKGKGTVATLLYQILKAAKKDVYLAGNIGTPALAILPKLKKSSVVILELSSFQLHDLAVSPHISVVLDLYPDHQDAHKSLREYYDAKSAIARFQTEEDSVFFVRDNPETRSIAARGKGKKFPITEKGFSMFGPDDIALVGQHNFKNAVMAAEVARFLKIPAATIKKVIAKFPGNEHRLEFVKEIRGIRFYNDSASTTPESLVAAMTSFPKTATVVLAGGKDKNLNYFPLLKALRSKATKDIALLVLFGENKAKIRQALLSAATPITTAADLPSAVRLAYKTLRPLAEKGLRCAIVFSPGAASFDMFANYAERGEKFKDLVQTLK